MHSKKHILLFVTVLLAMALLVAGAAATAFAEDIAFTVTKPDSSVITYPAGTAFSTVIGEAPAGSTVTLFADADVATAFGINKNVTVDLNGHTLTTTNRITPAGTAHIIVKNGTVEITKMELVYMDEGSSKDATFEFNSVTLKKGATAPNKLLADMRVGTIVFDGVTVNEGEWSVPASSANPLISMGYRTKEVSQTVKLVVKNSNIKLSGNSLANGSGASNETNGYTLDIDVSNSYISSTTAIFTVRPNAAGTMENNYIDICVTDGSELWSSTPISVNANVNKDHITFMLDYGVTSKKPTVGNVILGNDGNGVLDFVHGEFESSNTGTVADLWSNNQTPVAREDYAYTFVAVGDTQYITDSAHPEKLKLLYDWIINNKDAQNIQFVFGMGDITNHSRDDEWPVAMEQINRLNGVVPYSVVRGNHDTADTFNTNLNNETYRSMFDGFYSEDGAENAYLLFSVGEQDFLHITLDYHPSNAVLNWAAGIIQQYPMRKVIISTHDYIQHDGSLSTDGGSTSGAANSGKQMWDKLVSQYPNIFLVLSGHVYATEVGKSQMTGVYGNTVTAVMTDGQCHDFKNGPMGFISLLHFSEDGKKLTVEYYSTVHDKYFGKNSQFTLDIPAFDLSQVETPTYLYEITDSNGHSLSYADTLPLSLVLSNVTAGSTLKLLGDVSVDSGCTVPADVTIDLNGYTLSTDGGRISGNCKLTITNGTVKIVAYELVYISEGYTKSNVTFYDVDVVHAGSTATTTKKPLTEVRDGSLTLDNVRIEAANWLGTGHLMTLSSRTKVASAPVYVTIKNCDLNLVGSDVVYCGGNTNEVNGYAPHITIENSTITTTNAIFRTIPTADAAPLCSFDVSIDANTVLNSTVIFDLQKISTDKISVSIEAGAVFGGLPVINGANTTFVDGDVFVYNNTTTLLTLANSATVDTAKVSCKLVKADSSVLCYWEGSEMNEALVTYAQNAGCSIVLVGNMTTPAGASSSKVLNLTPTTLTVDLNGFTLTYSDWFRFTSSASTRLTIKNGTVKHPWNVYHSYNGGEDTSFVAENVKFISTTAYTSFDHRMGSMTLTNCTFEFTSNPTSVSNIFTFGYNKKANTVKVTMNGCTFTSSANQRNVIKLYNSQPTEIILNDCEFTLGSSAVILLADNTNGLNHGDKLTLNNCTVNSAGSNLFTVNYSSVDITLSEVYVKNGAAYKPANGTVSLAKGQTEATVEGGGYKITAPKATVEANLTLYVDFTLNIWLPADTPVTMLTIDGVEYPVTDAAVRDGKFFFPIESIGAGSAADDITILVTYTDGDLTLTATKYYSVIEYASSILEADKFSSEAKSLLAYITSYVHSVYVYDGKEIPTELAELIASEAYLNALELATSDGLASAPATTTDIGTATAAIKGVKLSLGSSVEFIFSLNPDYTGKLAISYAGTLHECDVVDGKVDGKDYVVVNMRAFRLYDAVISITAGEYSGSYDLAAYIEGVREDHAGEAAIDTLLINLYNYCKEANEYKAYVNASGGVLN